MDRRMVILTGRKRTGKTTVLTNWMDNNPAAGGILTPDKSGQRVIVHYPDKKIFPLQTDLIGDETIHIGRFYFSKKSFELANKLLLEDINSPDLIWVVFDEIGPLELNEKGLYSSFIRALQQTHTSNILLVVREGLVREVVEKFMIQDAVIIRKEGLDTL